MSNLRIDNIAPSAGGTYRNAPRGIAAAWVNFNGTSTVAIRDSENVGSITDNGAGNYNINFVSSFNANDYITSGQFAFDTDISTYVYSLQPRNSSTVVAGSCGVFAVYVGASASGSSDYTYNAFSAHGDLA